MNVAKPRARSAGAERVREWRRRERLGLRKFVIELDLCAVVTWLIDSGQIAEPAAENDEIICAALAKFIARSIVCKKL